MSSQAKCTHCMIRWTWPESPARIKDGLECPRCHGRLQQTTHRSGYATAPLEKAPNTTALISLGRRTS